MDILQSKYIGALMGTFTGDALGMPVEGWTTEQIKKRYGLVEDMKPARLGPGTYTDDTQMMIGLAESLLKMGRADANDIVDHFLENFEPPRGYGSGALRSLRLLAAGMPYEKASAEVFPGGSYGNGAAMRIAPVGVFYYDDPIALREAAHISAMPTHSHPLALNGAAVQACAVGLAIDSDATVSFDPAAFLEALKQVITSGGEPILEKLEKITDLLEKQTGVAEAVEELGNSVLVQDSVPIAIYCFLSHPQSVESTLVAAVNLGGDADTIGAMAGAISGAYHGYHTFPPRWILALENGRKGRDYVVRLGEELCRLKRAQ